MNLATWTARRAMMENGQAMDAKPRLSALPKPKLAKPREHQSLGLQPNPKE
jgi:hypothetical protein